MAIRYTDARAVANLATNIQKDIDKIIDDTIEETADTVLQVRLIKPLKAKFAAKCKENGTTPSAALRQFMREYVG